MRNTTKSSIDHPSRSSLSSITLESNPSSDSEQHAPDKSTKVTVQDESNNRSEMLKNSKQVNLKKRKRSTSKPSNDPQRKRKKSEQRKDISCASTPTDTLFDQENVPPPSRWSLVWQYATRCADPNYSICNLSPDNKRISTNNGSTSTLRQHLISKHGKTELILADNDNKISSSSCDVKKKEQLHDLIVNCIIRDSRTFNDFEKPGIRQVLKEAFPDYVPPGRSIVSRRLKRLNSFHRQKLIKELNHVDYLSITIDFWTNRRMHSFLVMTGHYFENNDSELKSKVLDFSTFNNRHTGYEISRILKKKIKQLGISQKIVSITCDGARNMINAVNSLGFNGKRLWCMAHRLHLTVIRAFGFWTKAKDDDNDSECEKELENFRPVNDEDENDGYVHVDGNDEDRFGDAEISSTDDMEVILQSDMENKSDMNSMVGDDDESLDLNDDEIKDNWSEDVVQSHDDLVPDQEMINNLLKKCRGLVSMVKRSTILTGYFDIERKKLNIRRGLCNDVKSRWNSTFHMIDSFLVLREAVEHLFRSKHQLQIKQDSLKKLSDLELTSDDWTLLSNLHGVLQPFFHATRALSGRKYPSIGFSYYLIMRLKTFLQSHCKKDNPILKRLKQLLLKQLSIYFEYDDEQLDLLKIHSYLDPAGFSILNDREKRTVEQHIRAMASEGMGEIIPSGSASSAVTTAPMNVSNVFNSNTKSKKSAIDAFNESIGDYIHKGGAVADDTSQPAKIMEDIRNYRTYAGQFILQHKPDESCSTSFWKKYGERFILLGKLARKLLCAPAT